MRYSQTSRCGTPLLSTVLTLKSDPGHRRQTWVCTDSPTSSLHRLLATAIFYPTIQCNCSACNVPSDAGLQKRSTFFTLNIGLDGTENQTQATCLAGSVARRSAIHYAYYRSLPKRTSLLPRGRLHVSDSAYKCRSITCTICIDSVYGFDYPSDTSYNRL
jgi:hypothetical protein